MSDETGISISTDFDNQGIEDFNQSIENAIKQTKTFGTTIDQVIKKVQKLHKINKTGVEIKYTSQSVNPKSNTNINQQATNVSQAENTQQDNIEKATAKAKENKEKEENKKKEENKRKILHAKNTLIAYTNAMPRMKKEILDKNGKPKMENQTLDEFLEYKKDPSHVQSIADSFKIPASDLQNSELSAYQKQKQKIAEARSIKTFINQDLQSGLTDLNSNENKEDLEKRIQARKKLKEEAINNLKKTNLYTKDQENKISSTTANESVKDVRSELDKYKNETVKQKKVSLFSAIIGSPTKEAKLKLDEFKKSFNSIEGVTRKQFNDFTKTSDSILEIQTKKEEQAKGKFLKTVKDTFSAAGKVAKYLPLSVAGATAFAVNSFKNEGNYARGLLNMKNTFGTNTKPVQKLVNNFVASENVDRMTALGMMQSVQESLRSAATMGDDSGILLALNQLGIGLDASDPIGMISKLRQRYQNTKNPNEKAFVETNIKNVFGAEVSRALINIFKKSREEYEKDANIRKILSDEELKIARDGQNALNNFNTQLNEFQGVVSRSTEAQQALNGLTDALKKMQPQVEQTTIQLMGLGTQATSILGYALELGNSYERLTTKREKGQEQYGGLLSLSAIAGVATAIAFKNPKLALLGFTPTIFTGASNLGRVLANGAADNFYARANKFEQEYELHKIFKNTSSVDNRVSISDFFDKYNENNKKFIFDQLLQNNNKDSKITMPIPVDNTVNGTDGLVSRLPSPNQSNDVDFSKFQNNQGTTNNINHTFNANITVNGSMNNDDISQLKMTIQQVVDEAIQKQRDQMQGIKNNAYRNANNY